MSRASKQQNQSCVIEQSINLYHESLSARIHCGPTVLSVKTNVKDSERSMEFIGFYIFKCHHGEEIRPKHYAGILLIEFQKELIYNMDTGTNGRVRTEPLSTLRVEAKMARLAWSACHDLYKIYQVLSLKISSWS